MDTARAWVGLLLLLTGALAGCSDEPVAEPTSPGSEPTGPTNPNPGAGPGPGPGPAVPPAPSGPVAIPLLLDFEFVECSGLSIAQPTNRSAVQALLPEGFTAKPMPNPTGEDSDHAMLAVDLFYCGNLTTPTASLPDTWFGHVYTTVQFPQAVPGAQEHAGTHEYMFRVLAAEDTLAILWPAAGYDTHNGSAQARLTGPLPPAGAPDLLVPATASIGDYSFQLAAAQAPDDQGETPFSRYTKLSDNSTLIWSGTYALPVTHTGAGDATLASDDPFQGLGAAEPGKLMGSGVIVKEGQFTQQQLHRIVLVD